VTDAQIITIWKKVNGWDITGFSRTTEELKKFAEEVAAAEREACADICDHEMDNAIGFGMKVAAGNCADKIRERGAQ